MNTASTIIKSLILPLVIKFSKGNVNTLPDDFWNQFATDFIHYENDATPIYNTLYQLELQNPEAVFEKLPQAYSSFIKELAEEYVLDNQSELTAQLIESKNKTFLKEVSFLKTMKAVIIKVERQELKKNLPTLYDRLVFELDEETLRQVAKKKSREDLRAKFKQWDEEMVDSEAILSEENHSGIRFQIAPAKINAPENKFDNKETKVISLSWMKYAVAACLVLATGIFFFRNTNQVIAPTENTVVTSDAKKDSTQPQKNIPVKEAIVLAAIETTTEKIIVQKSESMGFSSTTKPKITITCKDARQRIASLEKYIAVHSSAMEPATLEKYKIELIDLKKPNDNYVFDGKTLTLFSKFNPKQDAVLVTDDQTYFLKKGSFYYDLKMTNKTLPLKKVSDIETIDILEKINFQNAP